MDFLQKYILSYNLHGNVDTLLQDYNFGAMKESKGNRFKKLVYDYDVISGKVNKVSYQPGMADAFYHKYYYDAENRLTDVYTSKDSLTFERDSRYNYYRHGPLARQIIGQNQVQGIDYAYTLQGWLKGMNGTEVGSGKFDMGSDGINGSQVAMDAFGFSLNYFTNDYKAINANAKPFASIPNITGLYNGNIAAMTVSLPKVGEPLYYQYRYDQLNRLVKMNAFKGLNVQDNEWNPIAINDYAEAISYDANGNILTYKRNGAAAKLGMDNMTYQYPKDVNGKVINNRLRYVHDEVAAGNYADDIDSQTGLTLAQVKAEKLPEQPTDNYGYDRIGNLIKDTQEGISDIKWNVYGKILSITKNGKIIAYGYDAAGNRITKTVGDTTEIYVRDASGNVMLTYQKNPTINSGHLSTKEFYKYGSALLGVKNKAIDLEAKIPDTEVQYFVTGEDEYYLQDHRGNVYAAVSDKKLQVDVNNDGIVDGYLPSVVSAQDYFAFGKTQPGRQFGALGKYTFNGKEYDKETKWQDYGKRMYNPDLGRFNSVDPITASYPMLTPFQFASNRPIDGTDLDGLEYLPFHKSMYRLGYITETINTKTGGGKTLTMTSSRSILNTVYANIPAALQDSKTQSFQFVAGGPASELGRDYTSSELANMHYDKNKYFVTGQFYGTADGEHDPEPTGSTSGMGGAAINQARAEGASAVGSALGEEGAGVVKNMFNISTRNALVKEQDLRRGFYNATQSVNYLINNVKGWKDAIPDAAARVAMINFVTDGYLPTVETDKFAGSEYSLLRKNAYEKQLNTAWYGLQIIQQLKRSGVKIDIRANTKNAIQDLLQKYKSDGGNDNYNKITDLTK